MPAYDTPHDLAQIAPTRNPGAGRSLLYPKSDNKWYTRDSAGTETLVGPASLASVGAAAASHTHVATTDLTATGTKDSTTYLRGDNTWATPGGGGSTLQNLVGQVVMWAGNIAIPVGWLPCDGTSRLTTDYPDLFSTIGYTYGGSGTTFYLPNLQDRFPRGLSGTTFPAAPAQGGAATHTHTVNDHYHGITDHYHQSGGPNAGNQMQPSTGGAAFVSRADHQHGTGYTIGGGTGTGWSTDRGTDAPSNVPPYTALKFLIRATQAVVVAETGVNLVQRVVYAAGWPARPVGVNYVEWVGPVVPPNAIPADTWVNTTP